jgi:hypothetical protein
VLLEGKPVHIILPFGNSFIKTLETFNKTSRIRKSIFIQAVLKYIFNYIRNYEFKIAITSPTGCTDLIQKLK